MVRKAKCRDRLVKLCLLRSEGDGGGGGENEWGKGQVVRAGGDRCCGGSGKEPRMVKRGDGGEP